MSSSASPKLGLIGHPVSHSLSPKIFAALSARLGKPLSYEAVDTPPEFLADTLARLASQEWVGANVTIPHKITAAKLCVSLSAEAKLCGAVNTIKFGAKGPEGNNTDAAGFLDALAELGVKMKGADALIYGSGGAARAVGLGLAKAGARAVRFCARNPASGRRAARALHERYRKTRFSVGAPRPAALVVNATPLGMSGFPDEAPGPVTGCGLAFDLVYGRETAFLRAAKEAGIPGTDGLSMLLFQALRAAELWLGPLPERNALKQALVKDLQ